MKTRKLGNSTLEVTPIGLGTWAQGGAGWRYGWGEQLDQNSIDTIHAAVDSGINWVDTAAVYGLGHAEEVLGRALKAMGSSRPIIATKGGRHSDANGNIYGNLRANSIREEVDASLMRLGIEVIDLYQLHWPDPDEQIEEGWDTVARLIEAGKIRYGGVSNFSVEQMERIKEIHPITSLQPPYSMLKREIEAEILPYCKANNIGVICYSPLQKGLLTGTWSLERAKNLPSNDHRKLDPMFNSPKLEANLKLVSHLTEFAARHGHSMLELAIAWTLRTDEVSSAIVGARSTEQLANFTKAAEWKLSDADIEEVEDILMS